jgi:hypothetical protein
MAIEAISSSQFPSVTALLSLLVLAGIALKYSGRRSVWPWVATILFGVGTIAVVSKNLSYHAIIEIKHAENDLTAWHQYANSLEVPIVALYALGMFLFIMAMRGVPGRCWAAVTGVACLYAGLAMHSWQHTYRTTQVASPVQYTLLAPGAHWLLLGAFVVGLLVSVALLLPRRRTTAR